MAAPKLVTGFVDLQVNGYKGTSFTPAPGVQLGDLREACRAYLAESGAAAFCPTMVTAPLETYRRALPMLADLAEEEEFRGRIAGLHLEGPFISDKDGAVGAHDRQSVRPPSAALFDELQLLARGHVRIMTIAAELDGAPELCRHCVARGVAISLGHQLASAADIERLAAAGATLATHVANGIPNLMHRHENPVWPVLADARLSACIITDGHHLPPAVIGAIASAKRVGGTIVTSDIVCLGGMPAGTYDGADVGLGNEGEAIVRDPSGKVHMPARACLAGSGSTMLQCMNHLHSLGRWVVGLEELLAVGRENPLRALGEEAAAAVRAAAAQTGPLLRFTEERGFELVAESGLEAEAGLGGAKRKQAAVDNDGSGGGVLPTTKRGAH
jgi:N-acetylglucosamine-6-phosphate deacetylase